MDDRAERQRELARIYLEKAHQDLVWVEPVGDSAKIADEIIGFHIQQTIEKALKAVLTSLGCEYS